MEPNCNKDNGLLVGLKTRAFQAANSFNDRVMYSIRGKHGRWWEGVVRGGGVGQH